MQKTVSYRGLGIYIELRATSKDMFKPWFRIDGSIQVASWHQVTLAGSFLTACADGFSVSA